MGVFFLLPPRAAPWGCLQGADMTQHLAVLLHGLDQVLNENILLHGQLPPDNGLFGQCRPGRLSRECLQGTDVTQHLAVLLHGLDQILSETILLHGQLPPNRTVCRIWHRCISVCYICPVSGAASIPEMIKAVPVAAAVLHRVCEEMHYGKSLNLHRNPSL